MRAKARESVTVQRSPWTPPMLGPRRPPLQPLDGFRLWDASTVSAFRSVFTTSGSVTGGDS